MLHTVLRKASIAIELGCMSLQVLAGLSVPLLVMDLVVYINTGSGLLALLSNAMITLCVLRMFALAGAITDERARVPAFITSMPCGHHARGGERQKRRLIEHINNSAAGIYIFNVRLTTAITLKLVYVWIVVSIGISSHLLFEK